MSETIQKVAIVTGGSRGIGAAIAEILAKKGWSVMLVARTEETLAQKANEIAKTGGTVSYVVGDVKAMQTATECVEATLETFGRIDALVHAAGILGKPASFADISIDEWQDLFATNLTSIFLLSQKAIPHMQSGGNILNIASVDGLTGNVRAPAYAASKAGVISLTKSLALTYAPKIRVNAISPGLIDTDFIRSQMQSSPETAQKTLAKLASSFPMQRLGTPQDIAQLAAFILSDEASWLTGSIINLDGGALA